MPSLKEMAEAHLLNVQREIQTLKQRQVEIGEEIQKLEAYLEEIKQAINNTCTLPHMLLTPRPSPKVTGPRSGNSCAWILFDSVLIPKEESVLNHPLTGAASSCMPSVFQSC